MTRYLKARKQDLRSRTLLNLVLDSEQKVRSTWTQEGEFSFLYLNWNTVRMNSAPGKFSHIAPIKLHTDKLL